MATKKMKVGTLEVPIQDTSPEQTASDYISQAMDALKMQQGIGDPSNAANSPDPLASAPAADPINSGIQQLINSSTALDDATPDDAGLGGLTGGGPPPVVSGGPATPTGQGGPSNLGYGPEDQAAFDWIQGKESGGDPHAQNPTSTAFGRGQLLDYNRKTYADKLGIQNPDTTDPGEQDRMMQLYIQERYGTPSKAKQFWEAHGWY